MSENSLIPTIVGAVITTGLTLFGTSYLQYRESERIDHAKFLDGAQATAQDTSRLLAEGYSSLEKLTQLSHKNEDSDVILEKVRQYDELYRSWRQRLIENQFKISRYFGSDMSGDIIDLKEIEVATVGDPTAPEDCSIPGFEDNPEMNKLSERIRCLVTLSAFWDRRQKAGAHNSEQRSALQESRSINSENIRRQMISYEASYVRILHAIDDRFSLLGAKRAL